MILIKGNSRKNWCHKLVETAHYCCYEAARYIKNPAWEILAKDIADRAKKRAMKCCDKGSKKCANEVWEDFADYMYDIGYFHSDDIDDIEDIQRHVENMRRRRNPNYIRSNDDIPSHHIPSHHIPSHGAFR